MVQRIKWTETCNKLRVGDRVMYETEPDIVTHETEFIPGVVSKVLSTDKLILKNDVTGTLLEVSALYCDRVYDCDECFDRGYIIIPARQFAGDVVDEAHITCRCQKHILEEC